jgi:hypothetical protein
MFETKMKYVRLKDYNAIVIFPPVLDHSDFVNLNPISAGYCEIYNDKVSCWGESITLKLKAMDDDTMIATRQIFGSRSTNYPFMKILDEVKKS